MNILELYSIAEAVHWILSHFYGRAAGDEDEEQVCPR